MPLQKGYDKKKGKIWYRWGKHGKKYYGKNAKSRALKQGKAIYVNKQKYLII